MRFRLLDDSGTVLDEGDAVVELAGGALAVSPDFGQPLRVSPADIVEIAEPEPYLVRLFLADGGVLELSRLGAMRTQLLAELGEARTRDVPDSLLLTGVGRPETFPSWVGDVEAQLQLYDDALVVVPVRGDAEKVPYPFVRGVTTDPSGYRVTVEVVGRAPLTVHRLARRTTEFVELLGARHRAAAGRTAAFLGALLPGLGALGLRTIAASLRDGVAAARTDLDRVDGSVWPALTAATTLPDRVDCLRTLEELGPTWIGFKQLVSVERAAEGVRGWHDSAITPDLGDHGSPGSAARYGYASAWAAGFDGPFQAFGPALAYGMLGTGFGFGGSGFGGSGFGGSGFGGSGFGNQHRIVPRANVERGRLIPAHTDLDALTAGGAAPTVRAFAMCLTPTGRVVYEALNEPDHATYVYRGSGADAVAAVNRALDLTGFALDAVHGDAGPASSRHRAAQRHPGPRLLREAYLGRIAHTDDWADQLARHLAG